MSVAVHWPVEANLLTGPAFGYTRANNCMRAAAQAAGMQESDDAPVALHFCTPEYFHPIAGKLNALYAMYESEYLSPGLIRAFPQADVIITPSTYCANVFRNYTDRPIHVVPLGVDVDTFRGFDRVRPLPLHARAKYPFRWLWVGAWNIRKGCRDLLATWHKHFRKRRDCLLYVKTAEPLMGVMEGMRSDYDNIVFDGRLMSDAELRREYGAADGFVFPSYGEGFGLTLLEAMATALPCIAPLHAGVTEFADRSTCFDVQTEPYIVDSYGDGSVHKEIVRRVPMDALAERMNWVMGHWVRAKRVGLRAHKRAQQFTWTAAGQKLVTVLEHIAGTGRAACAA